MNSAKTFTRLANDVEELLDELKDEHGPEVQELRIRVEDALDAAKRGIDTEYGLRQFASARADESGKAQDLAATQ